MRAWPVAATRTVLLQPLKRKVWPVTAPFATACAVRVRRQVSFPMRYATLYNRKIALSALAKRSVLALRSPDYLGPANSV